MAWTAPRTWVNGEIETDTIFNTHVRDNFLYLKGLAGPVIVEDDLGVQRSSAGIVAAYINNTGAGACRLAIGMTPTGTTAWLQQFDPPTKEVLSFNRASGGNYVIQTTSGNTILNTNGVGLTVSAPQGKIHGYNTISGFLAWEFNGVDGTARTLIPDGTGDVQIGVAFFGVIQHSVGPTLGYTNNVGGALPLAPSGSALIYNAGGNQLTLAVSAGGALTIQRTAGTGTYKVALWLTWM